MCPKCGSLFLSSFLLSRLGLPCSPLSHRILPTQRDAMDYPLHQSQYTDSSNHSRHHQQQQQQQDPPANGTNSTANYRTYSMYNERSDISSIMFDGNSPSNEEDDSRSSMMLLSTRPPHSIHDPWNQPQLHHHQQHHSPLLSHDYRQHQPLQHHQIQQQSSHSERGIAGFVSKLYQYVFFLSFSLAFTPFFGFPSSPLIFLILS